jgi:hypothetical protein
MTAFAPPSPSIINNQFVKLALPSMTTPLWNIPDATFAKSKGYSKEHCSVWR